MDYYFLANRINHLEKLVDELIDKLDNEICNQECDQINDRQCLTIREVV